MGVPRHEYWNGLPFPSPGDLPTPGIELGSPASQADSLPTEPLGKLVLDSMHACSLKHGPGNPFRDTSPSSALLTWPLSVVTIDAALHISVYDPQTHLEIPLPKPQAGLCYVTMQTPCALSHWLPTAGSVLGNGDPFRSHQPGTDPFPTGRPHQG